MSQGGRFCRRLAPATEAAPGIALTTILLDQGSLEPPCFAPTPHKGPLREWPELVPQGPAHYALNRMAEAEEDFAVLTDSDPSRPEAGSVWCAVPRPRCCGQYLPRHSQA